MILWHSSRKFCVWLTLYDFSSDIDIWNAISKDRISSLEYSISIMTKVSVFDKLPTPQQVFRFSIWWYKLMAPFMRWCSSDSNQTEMFAVYRPLSWQIQLFVDENYDFLLSVHFVIFYDLRSMPKDLVYGCHQLIWLHRSSLSSTSPNALENGKIAFILVSPKWTRSRFTNWWAKISASIDPPHRSISNSTKSTNPINQIKWKS